MKHIVDKVGEGEIEKAMAAFSQKANEAASGA
jgi:hypothetical protein